MQRSQRQNEDVRFRMNITKSTIAISVTIALHKWRHQTLASIAGGTLCYVLLVQMVF